MLTLAAQTRVYLARQPTDMRKAFDGLCMIVRHQFHRDPFNGDVFAFFNRARDRVKLLVWDGNGFWLLSKRLERGTFDAWRPSGDEANVEIERAQLTMLLEGVDVKNAKYRRHFTRESVLMAAVSGQQPEANVETLDEAQLRSLVPTLMQKIASLEHQVSVFQRMIFGRRSEKTVYVDPKSLLPFPELAALRAEVNDTAKQAETVKVLEHTRKKTSRRAEFPDHLPRQRTEHTVADSLRDSASQVPGELRVERRVSPKCFTMGE